MDKLTAIKIKYDDGTYSDEIPISVLSENVEWDSAHTLVDVLGSIDVDVTGTIQDQISQLFNEKIDATDLNNYIASQLSTDITTWLNDNVDPVGSAVVVDKSLTIEGAAADAKTVGKEIQETSEILTNFENNTFDIIKSSNVFNNNWNSGYMNTTGETGGSASDYCHTDMIKVTNTDFIITGDSIITSVRMNVPARFITAFNANKQVVSTYGLQNAGSSNLINDVSDATLIHLDSNVKFIVVTIYKPTQKYKNISISFDISKIYYEEYGNDDYQIKVQCLNNIKEKQLFSFLSNKNIAVFGDSIMVGAGNNGVGPIDILATKYNMNIMKYCVSGATMGIRTDDPSYTIDEVHHIAKQIRNAISDEIVPDFIVFNGGTNDIGGNIPIGEITQVYTQPSGENFFANGFETACFLLKNNFFNIPLIYLRAHNMSSRSYEGQYNYGLLGEKITNKWGVINIDIYKIMNTQLEEYKNAFLIDYTHPNANGYNTFYIPTLENYFYNNFIK